VAGPPGAYEVSAWLVKGEETTELRFKIVLTGGKVAPDVEPTPKPTPDPKPAPVGTLELWVIVLEESGERTPATAKVVGDESWKAALAAKGHKFRLYDDDAASAKGYASAVKERPGLLLLDKNGDYYHTGPLPKATAEIDALIKKSGGK